jgi:hypothetical protein
VRNRTPRRVARFYIRRLGQDIPPLDSVEEHLDKRIASGESEDEATLAVVEDFERSGAATTARTTPLVPASGIIVAGAGILTKQSGSAEYMAFLSMALALIGLALLAMSLFTHVGRRSVGVPPTREDVAFAHQRLLSKEANANRGSLFSALGFLVLLAVVL